MKQAEFVVWTPSLGGYYPTSSLTIAVFQCPSLVRVLFDALFLHCNVLLGYCDVEQSRIPQGPCDSMARPGLAWLAS